MSKLDITHYKGKKQRLTTSIAKAVPLMPELPSTLLLTREQYDLIKMTRQFGDYRMQKEWDPDQRIYMTENNAMEVEIAKAQG
jgi:hypothetical protein